MHKHVITKSFVVLLLALSFNLMAQTSGYAQKSSPKTAVVDLNKLYKGLKELKYLQTQAKNRTLEIQKMVKDKNSVYEQLKGQMELAPVGSATYNEKKAKIQEMAIEMEVWQKVEQSKMAARDAEATANLYRKVLAAIAGLAKSKGIDLVLQKDMSPPFSKLQGAQLSTAVTAKRVLFASDELDITADVILKMNNEFQSGK